MMKGIAISRKLLGATPDMSLKELSTLYKSLMKKHHPDRFQDEAERQEAEVMSQQIIGAYKLLESMHPETLAAQQEDLEKALASNVANWDYKGIVLTIHFGNGSEYAFYGVQRNTYNKFVATNGTARFVKRNLVGSFTYRRVTGARAQE